MRPAAFVVATSQAKKTSINLILEEAPMSVAVAHDEHQSDDGELRRLLREAAATFARRGGVGRSRALRATRPGMDEATWKQMAEQGWLGTIVPEEFGGQGLGFG